MIGIVAALIFPYIFTGVPLYSWPLLFAISFVGSVAGTYLSTPTEREVLKSFYKKVKPWGAWEPIAKEVMAEDPSFEPNKRFKLDMFNVAIGIVGQCCLTLLPMYIVLSMKLPLIIVIITLTIIGFILKRTWWDKLED